METYWVLEEEERYQALNHAHDTGYKHLLEIKKIFVQLMRSFVKQGWVEKIDESSIEYDKMTAKDVSKFLNE